MATKNFPIPTQGFDDHDSFSLEQQYGTLFRNVRSNRRRVQRAPGGTLLAPSPVPSGITGRVVSGTLSTPTTTGSVVYTHTLGVAPKAILVNSSLDSTVGSVVVSVSTGMGISDLTTERGVVHTAVNNSNPTDTWKGFEHSAFYMLQANNGVTLYQGTLTAWDATTFTVNWTVVDSVSYTVGYTLFGGASVSAKVVTWTLPPATGNVSVATVGFTPQIVMHMSTDNITGATQGGGNSLPFGVMTASGQWSSVTHCVTGLSTAISEMGLSNARCLTYMTAVPGFAPGYEAEAVYVSMNVNGFTVNVVNAAPTNNAVASLALSGFGAVKVGVSTKPTTSAPFTSSVTGVGFTPEWVLASYVNTTTNSAGSNLQRSFGITDGTSQYVWEELALNSTVPLFARKLVRTDAVVGIVGTSGGEGVRGSFSSFDADGFTLSYAINNNTAGRFGWIALSGSASGPVGVIRNYAQLYVGAVTAVENFIMLTSGSAYEYTPATSSTGTWTGTAEAYTGTIYQRFSIVNTQGIAAWSQGKDNIRQFDGTAYTDLITTGTNHAAKSLIAFNDRIVSIFPVIASVDQPTQIRWCVNGNVNDWSGTGSGALEIIETTQDPLVTGFVLGDRAYLAKRNEIIELIATGSLNPVFATANRVSGMGVLARHSVAFGEQWVFWLGPDNVYQYDGSTLTPIGDRAYNTIIQYIDYNNLDVVQGAVYKPDSLYLLVVPPYLFVYDYQRDIWYQDDTTNFEAIGIMNVGTLFTADIDNSVFYLYGDSLGQSVRADKQAVDYLGMPIDSYYSTRDYTAEELVKSTLGGGWHATLWDLNSLREVRFQSNAGNVVEVGVSTDRGTTWDVRLVTTNSQGVGVAWYQLPFNQIRFRFRNYNPEAYEMHGQWGTDVENSGYQYPSPADS